MQRHSSRGVLRKRCSGNMLQIYRRTPITLKIETFTTRSAGGFSKIAVLKDIFKILSLSMRVKNVFRKKSQPYASFQIFHYQIFMAIASPGLES